MAHWITLLLSALVLSFTVVSCTSVSDKTLINAGDLLLRHELDNNYRDVVGIYGRWGAEWQEPPASEGALDPERMPDWAEDQYAACVYWEDEIHTESTVAQPGPDMIRVRDGLGWGWILLDKELSFHILETNLQWAITEDGEEVESFNRTFINAWDAPASE